MSRDLVRRKATRHRYYLANRDAFRARRLKWQRNNRFRLKVSVSLGVSLPEARAIIEASGCHR